MSFLALLPNPLFILKELQAESIAGHAALLRGAVLDVGCGNAPYRGALPAAAYVGMDVSPGPATAVCGRCEQLPFADSSFDAVVCTEVLEHLPRPVECLREIRRVLKDGGAAYITVPQSWPLHYEPRDYWRFTRYGMEQLCAEASLTVVSRARIGGVFSLVGVRLVDVVWTAFAAAFSFLGRRTAERLAALVCIPGSLSFYLLGKLADRIDQRDAICWAIVVRK